MATVRIGPLYLSLNGDELFPLGRALIAFAKARVATTLPAPDGKTIMDPSR